MACGTAGMPEESHGPDSSLREHTLGSAVKPGDVVTAMNGKTIEVIYYNRAEEYIMYVA